VGNHEPNVPAYYIFYSYSFHPAPGNLLPSVHEIHNDGIRSGSVQLALALM
jgi:hypothetical protein